MAISILDDRLDITLVEDWDVRYRRVYGYIGEIKPPPACVTQKSPLVSGYPILADHECGAKTPALFQVVAQLPFRCGSTKFESYDFWLHCRISAFASAARFNTNGRTGF